MSRSRVASLLALSVAIVAVATPSAATSLPMVASQAQTEKVYKSGDGVTLPVPVHEVKPDYTPEAMQQRIQGSVFMQCVVLADGTVGEVRITGSLDPEFGLDRQASEAVAQWRFKPGTKDGRPVPVEVEIEVRFTLR